MKKAKKVKKVKKAKKLTMLSDGQETQPLHKNTKEVSLRFPEGENKTTDGAFDGNDARSEPFSYATRGPTCPDGYESSIPEPSKQEIDEAAAKGIDPKTDFPTQPVWSSVLKKRQSPWFWVRWLLCNCFCHPRWSMTRAQWIWFMNLVLFVLYSWYTIRLWGETSEKGDKFMATVLRQKISYTASNASNTSMGTYTVTLVDNEMPIRVDVVAGGVFFVSAIISLFVVLLGPFDRWIFFLWRQLDLAFVYWRWLDLLITFPMMMMVLCCITELRDENTIAAIWMLCTGTVACFFLTELWSRPTRNSDRSYDMSRWSGDEAAVKPGLPSSYLSPSELIQRNTQMNRRYGNFVIRTLPIGFGIFPFVALWWIFLNHFYDSRSDLRVAPTDDLLARTPFYIQMLVYGTLVFSALHFLPTLWYQWQLPLNHWKSEIVNSTLSVIFKFYFGYYIYEYVLIKDSLAEALVPL